MKSNYIKVTPKGGGNSTVVPTTNEAYYKSQGYIVDEPTEDEIQEFHPSGKINNIETRKVEDTSEYNALAQELETVKVGKTDIESKLTQAIAKIQELETVKVELEKNIADLNVQLEKLTPKK